jgi:hypothetical protein
MHRVPCPLPVALSLWGSDLVWFTQKERHRRLIAETLQFVDHLLIECRRDRELARELGYRGDFSPPIPASGGLHVKPDSQSDIVSPSERIGLVVKGYTGFVGRADVALKVLITLSPLLEGRPIHFYSVGYVMLAKLKLARWLTGLDIRTYLKKSLSHDEVLALFQTSRVSLSLSLSDGLPGSMREAALTGAFPIESVGSCVCDWASEGAGCLIVDPENPEEVASAVMRALQDDVLVDGAVEANREFVQSIRMENVRELAQKQYDRLMTLRQGSL